MILKAAAALLLLFSRVSKFFCFVLEEEVERIERKLID
jgi:hypothetical protein